MDVLLLRARHHTINCNEPLTIFYILRFPGDHTYVGGFFLIIRNCQKSNPLNLDKDKYLYSFS